MLKNIVRFYYLIIYLMLTLFSSQYTFAQTNPLAGTSEGFVDKEYTVTQEAINKALQMIFVKCVAVSTEILEGKKGIIRSWGVGDRNGKFRFWSGVSTIKELDIKNGGVIVDVKIISKDNTVTVGFKVGEGDKESSKTLHNLLVEQLQNQKDSPTQK